MWSILIRQAWGGPALGVGKQPQGRSGVAIHQHPSAARTWCWRPAPSLPPKPACTPCHLLQPRRGTFEVRRGDKVYVSLQVRVPSFLCWRSQCRGAPSHLLRAHPVHLPHPALLHSTSSASFLPPTAHHVLLSCARLAQTLNPSSPCSRSLNRSAPHPCPGPAAPVHQAARAGHGGAGRPGGGRRAGLRPMLSDRLRRGTAEALSGALSC